MYCVVCPEYRWCGVEWYIVQCAGTGNGREEGRKEWMKEVMKEGRNG
jgi:hypothetical protein